MAPRPAVPVVAADITVPVGVTDRTSNMMQPGFAGTMVLLYIQRLQMNKFKYENVRERETVVSV